MTVDPKAPVPDAAEHDAFFPSAYSLSQFTKPKSDLADAEYPQPAAGTRGKILVIGADERYVPMDNGTLFSSGNHPIETLVPMIHLDRAGFEFDVATISGNPVKFEHWAMPKEDEAVKAFYEKMLPQFRTPEILGDVVSELGGEADYVAVFIPGGHGALVGLPDSADVAEVLEWAMENDRYVISLCHGPAAFLAAGHDGDSVFAGYKICAFPDAMDKKTPDMGYMPGQLPWFFGEELKAQGLEIVNTDATGAVHKDRKVLTGDSPAAANALGKLAAETLLADANGAAPR